ncbi:MAG TPA: hypothetical protein VFM50_09800 [Nocardioidaceae bacterium]|nr:hypothetical protein [Nocardioidaceae bacterium]
MSTRHDPLAAFTRYPDWLAAGMDGDRVAESLQPRLHRLGAGDATLVACHPERLRAKQDQWVARYRLRLRRPGGRAEEELVLVGRLWAPHQWHDGNGAGWTVSLPDLRLTLRPQPHDVDLPALPELTDPARMAGLLQRVVAERYPGTVVERCVPHVVRYKPGSRCTLVVDVAYAGTPSPAAPTPAAPNPVVVKTHQGDKGAVAWQAMTALWERADRWRGELHLAEPLAYLPVQRVLVQGPIPEEQTLKLLAARAFGAATRDAATHDGAAHDGAGPVALLRTALRRTAHALAVLHGTGAVYPRTWTLEQELTEVGEVVDRLALTVPALAGGAAPLRQGLATRAAAYPPDPPVPAHHDFRPAQVLLHGDELGFIDFDGAAMAEPALDLGRFRAKLRDTAVWAHLNAGGSLDGAGFARHLALVDVLCEELVEAYLERAAVSRQRVMLWETCDLLTTMLHAWTKVRLARLEPRLAILRHATDAHRS